jgi:hypothetical protein
MSRLNGWPLITGKAERLKHTHPVKQPSQLRNNYTFLSKDI